MRMILIVDDSATTRAFIKRTIRMAGLEAETFEAGNGKIALDLIAANPVDLVLADLHMPEMDGAEMTRRLLADPKTAHIPVIVVSADPNTVRIDSLKAAGIKGYIRKPFTPESIRDVLNNVLGVANA